MYLSKVGFYFWQVFVCRVLFFRSEHFLTIFMTKTNKMTENNVRVVWMQKEVIMCLFVTSESFRAYRP